MSDMDRRDFIKATLGGVALVAIPGTALARAPLWDATLRDIPIGGSNTITLPPGTYQFGSMPFEDVQRLVVENLKMTGKS